MSRPSASYAAVLPDGSLVRLSTARAPIEAAVARLLDDGSWVVAHWSNYQGARALLATYPPTARLVRSFAACRPPGPRTLALVMRVAAAAEGCIDASGQLLAAARRSPFLRVGEVARGRVWLTELGAALAAEEGAVVALEGGRWRESTLLEAPEAAEGLCYLSRGGCTVPVDGLRPGELALLEEGEQRRRYVLRRLTGQLEDSEDGRAFAPRPLGMGPSRSCPALILASGVGYLRGPDPSPEAALAALRRPARPDWAEQVGLSLPGGS